MFVNKKFYKLSILNLCMVEEDRKGEDFNDIHSGQSTLKRLDNILNAISSLHLNFDLKMNQKQTIKIELIRQFFISAVPVLERSDIEKYKSRVFQLKTSSKVGIKSGAHVNYQQFDKNLEVELDTILIELQILLKSTLMPTSKIQKNKKRW